MYLTAEGLVEGTVVQWFALLPHMSAWVTSRCSGFPPKDMHVGLIVYSQLPVGVNDRVNGC